MDAKLLFFTRAGTGRWSFTAVPISKIQLDSTPSIPEIKETDCCSPLSELVDSINRMCANGGIMDGWKLHLLDEPVPRESGDGYHTKAIFTRTSQPDDLLCPSNIDSNSKEVREEAQ